MELLSETEFYNFKGSSPRYYYYDCILNLRIVIKSFMFSKIYYFFTYRIFFSSQNTESF